MKLRLRWWPVLPLGLIVVAAYWFPVTAWIVELLASRGLSLPEQFPFFILAERTLLYSACATALSILLAYPFVLAWRLSYGIARAAIMLPIGIPLVMGLLARNYSWIGILTNQGAFGAAGRRLLGSDFLFSPGAIVLVMATVFVPVAFFILLQGTRAVLPEHIEAARALGVPPWKTLFVVIVPITFRAAALAFGFILALSVGFFVTPRMIGGGKFDFLGNAILAYVDLGSFHSASAIALAFLALVLPLVIALSVYSARRRRIMSGR